MESLRQQSLNKASDRHLYAVGCIRVMETRLLDPDVLRDLIEAPTLKDVYGALRDTDYGEGVVETEENMDFEKMLYSETRNLIRIIDSMSPDPELTDLFVFPYDIQNLKILFKVELGGALESGQYYTFGRFPISDLRSLVKGDPEARGRLPEWIRETALEVRETWKKIGKLRVIDAVLDRALVRHQMEEVLKADRPILLNFFQFIADINNVESFIRIRISDRSTNQFEQFFIPGGILSISFFRESWKTSIRDLDRHFEDTPFARMVVKSLEEYKTEGSLTMMELEEARLLVEQIVESRYVTFGPEPILAYLALRLFEMKILRLIMVAKKNSLSVEELRKRVIAYYA